MNGTSLKIRTEFFLMILFQEDATPVVRAWSFHREKKEGKLEEISGIIRSDMKLPVNAVLERVKVYIGGKTNSEFFFKSYRYTSWQIGLFE